MRYAIEVNGLWLDDTGDLRPLSEREPHVFDDAMEQDRARALRKRYSRDGAAVTIYRDGPAIAQQVAFTRASDARRLARFQHNG